MSDDIVEPQGAPEPGSSDPTMAMPETSPSGPYGGGPLDPTFGGGDESGPGGVPNWLLIAASVPAALIVLIVIIVVLSGSDDADESGAIATVESSTSTTLTESTTTEASTTTVAESTTTSTTTSTVPETTTTTEVSTTTVAESTTTVPATTTVASTTLPVVTVPPLPQPTLWDVIENSPALSEFRAAIEAAGLVDLLDGPEPVTVFAPSNAAFELLRAGVGGTELLDDPEPLMRRHLVAGLFRSTDVLASTTLDSLAGETLSVDATAVTVDGARLIVVDVEAGGSVLHVIDRVMIGSTQPT